MVVLFLVNQSISFKVSTFPYMLFLEQGVGRSRIPRYIILTWALSCIVLTVQYQGKNIDRLTSQLPPRHLDTLEELLGNSFRLYSPRSAGTVFGLKSVINSIKRAMTREQGINYDANSSELDTNYLVAYMKEDPMVFELMEEWSKAYTVATEEAYANIDLLHKIQGHLYKPRSIWEWLSWNLTTIAHRIGACNNSASIANYRTTVELNSILKVQLTSTEYENIHISSKPAFNTYASIIFTNIPGHPEQFTSRWRTLAHSGLLDLWSKWEQIYSLSKSVKNNLREFHGRRENDEIPNRLAMKSNIKVVYWVWLSMCTVAGAAFIGEILEILNEFIRKIIDLVDLGSCKTVIFYLIQQIRLYYKLTCVSKKIIVERLRMRICCLKVY